MDEMSMSGYLQKQSYDEVRAVETVGAVERVMADLDRALTDLAESVKFGFDRCERLQERIRPVLIQDSPSRPLDADVIAEAASEVPLAATLQQRVAQAQRIADEARTLGRRLDNLGDRVAL